MSRSLSAYARQFLEMMQKPDVDQIDGLSPAISIEQKTTSNNPRSTVGTVTEIHDYMRLLWARVGIPYSPATGLPIESQTVSQMVDRVLALPERTRLFLHRADRARTQGRIPQGNRRSHEARLPAPQDRRTILRHRRRADARQEAQARHRGRGRPHRRAARHGEPARRELRDRARTRRRAGGGRIRGSAGGRRRRGGAASASCFRRNSPARSPASPSPRSSRACSRSTIRSAPARSAAASARSSRSIPTLVVPDPKLTLREGAIAPWAKSQLALLPADAGGAGASTTSSGSTSRGPDLPEAGREVILYGSGEEEIRFSYDDGLRAYEVKKPFEGVVPNLERRYMETESEWSREEIAALHERDAVRRLPRLSPQAGGAGGQDRRPAYRRSLRAVGAGGDRLGRRPAAKLDAKRNEIAGRILQGDPRPAHLPASMSGSTI